MMPAMKSHTVYKTFNTDERREFVRITDDVQAAVDEAGIAEGMVLVSAMHITAGVWVNDDEPGIQADALEWLDKIAPPSWQPPANDVAQELLPDGGDYRHHRGGEDNGDAHLKNFGILYGDPVTAADDARLSPVYDLVCSTVYLPRDVLALSLLGSKAWPDRRTLERFGREACAVKNAGATIHDVVEKALTYQPEDPGAEMWKKIRAKMIAATQTLRARK